MRNELVPPARAPWQVLDPEKQADMLDSLRIYLLQYATLLVEHAPHHIHDNNKNRNSKLRRLMTFAWPCLLSKACVDPACKYSGHLLLAHIIAKFAIHKKIVLQVLCSASCLPPYSHLSLHLYSLSPSVSVICLLPLKERAHPIYPRKTAKNPTNKQIKKTIYLGA